MSYSALQELLPVVFWACIGSFLYVRAQVKTQSAYPRSAMIADFLHAAALGAFWYLVGVISTENTHLIYLITGGGAMLGTKRVEEIMAVVQIGVIASIKRILPHE